jgi:hypothetical protein
MNLLELRKYAICRRVEIRFGNSISQECLINNKGQVKILGEDKNFRVEDIFNAAEKFVITGNENARRLTREEMARTIAEASEGSGDRLHAEEDE